MHKEFLKHTSVIKYSADTFEREDLSVITDIDITKKDGVIKWFNTYGMKYRSTFQNIIQNNNLDDFLIKLTMDEEHSNKVIELDDVLFTAIRVLKTERSAFDSEQMIFIMAPDFIWSIQEKQGDYFDWIRERLEHNKGVIRKKKADYLLFLLIESIIDNYHATYHQHTELSTEKLETSKIKPTPEFTALVEKRKRELFNFKKASTGLRDMTIKLGKVEIEDMETKYFSELKEQVNNLISDIDFDLQELESKINLIFTIQGHRLNEVIKTLTIFSVVFIPLTFLAGIYGMNFENMPELKFKYGYFILLGMMLLITLFSIWYFSRKKWF